MENQTAKIVATVLGAVGFILILAGPAFCLLYTSPSPRD